jgi:rhodanese-related sulfurtransferase
MASPENFILVDVRSSGETQISMIPGAITLKEFEAQYPSPSFTNLKIVAVHCTIGYRSGLYSRELIKRGFSTSQVANHEGILMHTYLGQALQKKESSASELSLRVFEVHTYGFPWSKLAEPTFKVHYYGQHACTLL